MPIINFLLVLLFVVSVLVRFDHVHQQSAQDAEEAMAQVGSLLVYRNQVTAYAQANPSFTGAVDDSLLGLPSWYQKTPGAGNYLQAGISYVYLPSPLPGVVGLLARRTESSTVGTNQTGQLSSPRVGSTGIALPAQVPQGAVVMVQ